MSRRLTLITGIVLATLSLVYLVGSVYRARAPFQVGALGELYAPTLGQADARQRMVVFTDYRCPHCRAFEREVTPHLEALMADGELSLTLVPVAMVSEDSDIIAAGALCAARQGDGVFVGLHKSLFDLPGVNVASLVDLGARHGAGPERLRGCLEGGEAALEVEHNTVRARELGLRGTPTVVFGGKAYANPSWVKLQGVVGGR